MDKVINLLKSEKQHLKHQISFYIDEIETAKKDYLSQIERALKILKGGLSDG